MKTMFAAAAAAAMLAGSVGAQAQESGTTRGVRMLDMLRSEAVLREANRGERLLSAEVGSLSEGQNREVHLVGGWSGTMTVIGYCDQYCGDLDLYVVDDTGAEVASDVSINDTPVVTFSASSSRTYRLRIRMYRCQADQVCMYGAAAFWR